MERKKVGAGEGGWRGAVPNSFTSWDGAKFVFVPSLLSSVSEDWVSLFRETCVFF